MAMVSKEEASLLGSIASPTTSSAHASFSEFKEYTTSLEQAQSLSADGGSADPSVDLMREVDSLIHSSATDDFSKLIKKENSDRLQREVQQAEKDNSLVARDSRHRAL